MLSYKYCTGLIAILVITLFTSCNKTDFLSAKSSSNLVVASTMEDFDALLNDFLTMNQTPCFGEISSDVYFLKENYWSSFYLPDRYIYVWADDPYDGQGNLPDWNALYKQVFVANLVIEGISNIKPATSDISEWNRILGSALFFRSYAYYHLAQVFAPPFNSATANEDLGLPLKLNSDINDIRQRSSLGKTYQQILEDATEAVALLKDYPQAKFKNRPGCAAAYAFLARIYLSMREYEKAGLYADSSLGLHNKLIDYNSIAISGSRYYPFNFQNDEVIFQSIFTSSYVWYFLGGLSNEIGVDSTLYQSYNDHDLRKKIFFFLQPNGVASINGTYSGTLGGYQPFSGLATDEVLLIRAEAYARMGQTQLAIDDLNLLLSNRWEVNHFTPITVGTAEEALEIILEERRKELLFRNRWSDLRRLNLEGAQIIVRRLVNGEIIELEPMSSRYVLPVPSDEIALSGITQNLRK